MDTVLLISIAPIALLLVLGAFFAGSETALTAVSRGRMHQLEKDGSRAARDVNHLLQRKWTGRVLPERSQSEQEDRQSCQYPPS